MHREEASYHHPRSHTLEQVTHEEEEQADKEPHLQPLLLTIAQVAQALQLSRAKVYQLITQQRLPIVRIDRAVRISALSLHKWIADNEIQRKTEDLGERPLEGKALSFQSQSTVSTRSTSHSRGEKEADTH